MCFVGLGNGMLFYSSSVILQQYFERRRSLATALATTGYSLSPMMFAPLTSWLVNTFSWRGALLILSGVYMQSAIGASLMRPVHSPHNLGKLCVSLTVSPRPGNVLCIYLSGLTLIIIIIIYEVLLPALHTCPGMHYR